MTANPEHFKDKVIPNQVPIIPVRNTVFFPHRDQAAVRERDLPEGGDRPG